MQKITFTKMVASGNDFVVVENIYPLYAKRYPLLARKICDRKYGIGADGLLVLEKSRKADVRMRIFNSDGSEAEMCGNGARCVAYYYSTLYASRNSGIPQASKNNMAGKQYTLKIETKAGIIYAEVNREDVKIKLTDPKDIRLGIPIKVNNRAIRVSFINTGVPHTVVFVEGLDKINVVDLGRQLRYHKKFKPQGTNVNFVEALSNDAIKVRTYERGVEDETLACGTGSIASSLVYAIRYLSRATRGERSRTKSRDPLYANGRMNIYTKSGEKLKVYFDYRNNKFSNVWLEGKARIVCKGEYYV